MTLQLKPFAGSRGEPIPAGVAGAAAPGAEASGIDLGRPLSAEQVKAIEDAMDRYAVSCSADQPLDQDQQIPLAQSFGPLDLGLRKVKGGPHRFKYAELADISNVKVDGEVATASTPRSSATSPTSSGTATARSSSRAPSTRCCRRWSCRPKAARPSSPTCARPTTRCRRWRKRAGRGPDRRCTTRCTRASCSATPITPRNSARRSRRRAGRWCRPIRAPAARSSSSASTPARSTA